MSDELKNLIDKEGIAEYFPEIFEAFSHTADGKYVYICNIPEDYSYWSKEAVDYFGLPDTKMRGAGNIWTEHIELESRERYAKNIKDLFEGKTNAHDMIYRARTKKGDYVTCSCKGRLIRDKDGNPKYFAGTIVNHEMGDNIDAVTGLYTRNSLLRRMEQYEAEKKPYYLLIIGARNFFDINSGYGYTFGNKVLKTMMEYALKNKWEGMLFRPEGTKAVLLMDAEGNSREELCAYYEKLRRYYKTEMVVDDVHVAIDICGSLLVEEDFHIDVNSIYNNAFFALDSVKRNNSMELNVVDNEVFLGNQRHLKTLNCIRECVINNFEGFYLCYQPIVYADTEQVAGMESLLRWRNDEYGIVPPNEFIPWLENDPLFFELGNWILRRAMRDTKELLEQYPHFIVNVNLAYPQLQRSDFKRQLNEIVQEEGFPADNLKLELTERCRLLDTAELRSDMDFFKSEGMQTALDDFGTGYAALNLITELPVDQIKIDKSFIDDIEHEIPKQSLLRAITVCAKELGKTICVEGIETREMADYIKDNYPVTHFQGYYYSRPLPIDEFYHWLSGYQV